MAKIIEFSKTLRRHWKKSTFFFGILAYGSSYGFDRYKTFQMMRAYCEEAKKYGEQPLRQMAKPKHVTVILNPEANYKKANIQFEKFVSPLLHLAGFKVSVFQTEFTKQAGKLMEIMSNTDAVIVAGGDGTLHEVVTGLMSRSIDEADQYPLGVVPLGKTNTVANHLFGSKSSSSAQLMAEATMAVIRENTVSLDVLRIQYGEEKPVFALCQFEQGAFADIEPLVEKYWYLGALKDKFTYFKNAFKWHHVVENHNLEYVAPCEGCSKCKTGVQKKSSVDQGNNRWWHAFIPRSNNSTASNPEKDWSKIINEECGNRNMLKSYFLNISSLTATAGAKDEVSSGIMYIKIYPSDTLSMMKFISNGLSHRKSKLKDPKGVADIIAARELIIDSPRKDEEEEEGRYCYIDKEKYPRGSCKISILPKQITVYG